MLLFVLDENAVEQWVAEEKQEDQQFEGYHFVDAVVLKLDVDVRLNGGHLLNAVGVLLKDLFNVVLCLDNFIWDQSMSDLARSEVNEAITYLE